MHRTRLGGVFGRGGARGVLVGGRRAVRPLAEGLEGRALLSTLQNFDDPGTSYVLRQFGESPEAVILPASEGIEDQSLRLASAAGATSNTIGFPRTDQGRFRRVDIAFDMRGTPVSGRGEGLGFALLNTSLYGYTGSPSAPGNAQEEPNFSGSFGLGFDVNKGTEDATDNSISVHFNGAVVQELAIPKGFVDFADGKVIHVQAMLNLGESGSSMTLLLTPAGGSPLTVVEGLPIPGLQPYESRVFFGGRSGKAANFDIDNINVASTGSLPEPAFRFGAKSYQVREDAGHLDIQVTREGADQLAESVRVVTINGTAASGRDYTAFAGTLDFAVGESSKTVRIPILDNNQAGTDRQFTVILGSGGTGPTQLRATVTILDDETIAVPPTVSPVAQALHRGVERPETAFVLSFSKPMSATVTDTSRYQVILLPADRHGQSREVAITGAVYDATKRTVTLSVAEGNLPAGRLRIVAKGTGNRALTDLAGNALDGNRDGRPGGDAILRVRPSHWR